MSSVPHAPVRVVVVGAGGIAQAYADLLAGATYATAVGVADIRYEQAETWGRRVGCAYTDDPRDLLELDPELVVVCTPPSTHPEMAETFAAHGVNVLSEKPLAVDKASALMMVDSAERHGVLLGMAAKFRFCADLVAVAELMGAGNFGRVRLVENTFTSRVDMRNRWNSHRPVSGGGVIIDNGTHSVDLVGWMAGPVTAVLAVEQARPDGFDVEDTARLHLTTESGADATVDLSWSIDKSMDDFVKVYGTEGEARVGWKHSAWRPLGGEWITIGSGYSKLDAMGGALAQFCRAIRGIEAPVVDAPEGVRSAAVVDAAYESLAIGNWAKVDTSELG